LSIPSKKKKKFEFIKISPTNRMGSNIIKNKLYIEVLVFLSFLSIIVKRQRIAIQTYGHKKPIKPPPNISLIIV
jgi:hypothetical protein